MNQSLRNLSISGIVAVALLLLSAQAVTACGCYSRATVLQDYEQADLVIIARLVSLVKATEPTGRPGGDISSATMVVEKVFKGEVEAKQKLTFGQGDEILGCSWSFYEKMIGERYLLYLDRPEKPSEPFYITTCNRSRGLEYADDDLLYLNNIDKVRGQTRVSGILNVDGGEDGGQTIRIIGKRKTYAATTDKNGVYELYDLPPGRYVLEPELKFGWKVDEFHLTRQLTRSEMINPRPPSNRVAFTLRPGKHFGIDIRLRLSNHVSGTIRDASGKPMQWVCVSLAPVDNERYLGCNSLTDELGRFRIDSVEAGKYLIILNYENKRTTAMPFPKLYYKGVTERGKATTITVKHGGSVEKLNLAIPALDETIKVEGVVRYSDGRPAAGRWVGFKTTNSLNTDGNIHSRTDKNGRFKLTLLKGLKGEIYSTFPPEKREFATCPTLKKLLLTSGKDFLVFETPHLNIEDIEDKTNLLLQLPVSPCRDK